MPQPCSTAGKYRHLVLIEWDAGTIANSLGETVPSWTTLASVWADIQPRTAAERWGSLAMQAEATHVVRIRYRQGVTSAQRVRFNGRVLHILGVIDPGERRRELVLECKEQPQ